MLWNELTNNIPILLFITAFVIRIFPPKNCVYNRTSVVSGWVLRKLRRRLSIMSYASLVTFNYEVTQVTINKTYSPT